MLDSLKTSRLEDGSRSIADNIIKRLGDLDKTVDKNRGRWAWELLQNAKDSIAATHTRKVAIKVEYHSTYLKFSHNGSHFTDLDIRGIINQLSSKERSKAEQPLKTGRFGTGFLTTHLLSRKVIITGILKAVDNNRYHAFEFLLDRTAENSDELRVKLDETWSDFFSKPAILDNYDETIVGFNTTFHYILEADKQRSIAEIGLDEFIKLLPLVLTFIPKLESVEIIDYVREKQVKFEVNPQKTAKNLVCIQNVENKVVKDLFVLTKTDEQVTIAVLLKQIKEGFAIQPINDFPKLFCDFPLIGTEKFYFPVIVNSFYFNPLTERDGLWLKDKSHKEVAINQALIERTVLLVKKMIQDLEQNDFYDLYNIAKTEMPKISDVIFDETWFKIRVQAPLRNLIYKAKIVEIENLAEKRAIESLDFPTKHYLEPVQLNLWQYIFDLNAGNVCKKVHLAAWSRLSWNSESIRIHSWQPSQILWHGWKSVSYSNLLEMVEKYNDVTTLSKQLNRNEENTFNWLNNLYTFVLENDNNLVMFKDKAIIPNRKGVFKKKTDLKIDKINDDMLLEILAILGNDWNDILIHPDIHLKDNDLHLKDKQQIAIEITKVVKEKIEGSSTTDVLDEQFVQAIILLMKWFDDNLPEEGSLLFPELHRKKADIFLNTISDKENLYKIMRSDMNLGKIAAIVDLLDKDPSMMENATQTIFLRELLRDFGLTDLEALRNRLQNIIPVTALGINQVITKELLAGAGITTLEELKIALKDTDLGKYVHYSTPDFNLLQYVKSIIERAKQNVIEYLKTLKNYDCTDMEELTGNVLSGITKNNIPITVVIRPSDNGFIILYSDSEKGYLEFEQQYTELWIDNGIDKPRYFTLGKILKNLGINKISAQIK